MVISAAGQLHVWHKLKKTCKVRAWNTSAPTIGHFSLPWTSSPSLPSSMYPRHSWMWGIAHYKMFFLCLGFSTLLASNRILSCQLFTTNFSVWFQSNPLTYSTLLYSICEKMAYPQTPEDVTPTANCVIMIAEDCIAWQPAACMRDIP